MYTRRFIAAGALLALAAQLSFAGPKSGRPAPLRFYGKITNVTNDQSSITVHNQKKNEDGTFQLSDETRITENKQSVSPQELKVGQSLVVYYVSENNIARAKRIAVRLPKTKQD